MKNKKITHLCHVCSCLHFSALNEHMPILALPHLGKYISTLFYPSALIFARLALIKLLGCSKTVPPFEVTTVRKYTVLVSYLLQPYHTVSYESATDP